MTIEIVAFQPQHIEEVLTILHESNCLHYQNNPDYFASRDKSVSRPYLEWILKDPNTFGFVALSQQVVAGIVVAGLETRIDNIYQADKYYKIHRSDNIRKHCSYRCSGNLHSKRKDKYRVQNYI